jgi:hypothetical protein
MKAFANRIGYSDVYPFEVVRVVSEKTLEVRAMNAVELPWERTFHVGGFFGNVSNQENQVWSIQPDKDGEVLRIRLRADGKWYDKYGDRYLLSEEPRRFHDYNF